MHSIFCYGTLQIDEIIEKVTGRKFKRREAFLDNFAAYTVKDKVYPGLVEQPSAVAHGVVFDDVTDEDLLLLDEYEGEEYFRAKVTLAIAETGKKELVWVYYYKINLEDNLTREFWSVGEFCEKHLNDFVLGEFCQ